jgi:sulfur-oxidizing protein SoxY
MLNTKLISLKVLTAALIALVFSTGAWAESDPTKWPILKEAFFAEKKIEDAPFIKLTAPRRAESGAQVPFEISVDQVQAANNKVKKIYVLVDANPIPMTATYHLTEALGNFSLATRIRLETDSFVRVVGETADGRLFMSSIEIRAAGGCGGTVDANDAETRANAGKIKLNVASPIKTGEPTSATFIIKHPMRTGLQRDLVSQGFVPAFFIQKATFTYNNKPVMDVDLGVGTSEDPYLRFNFIPDAPGTLKVNAVDNEGKAFSSQIEVTS